MFKWFWTIFSLGAPGISVFTTKNFPDSGIWIPLHWANQSQGSYPFLPKKIKDFSKTFKVTFPIFQGLYSVQRRALSLCLFQFFQNMSNFILKVFLCLLGWIKLAPKFKDFPALAAIFKDFQGLEFLLGSLSKDVSGQYTSTRSEAFYVRRSNTSLLKLFILKFKDFQGACEPCSY